jgi:hypothetical protein
MSLHASLFAYFILLAIMSVLFVFTIRHYLRKGDTLRLRMVYWPMLVLLPLMWFLALRMWYGR